MQRLFGGIAAGHPGAALLARRSLHALVAHLHPTSYTLATLSVIFAFAAFVTNTMNYAIFSACVTSYIVVLLSLHQIQSTVIAHRRAWCTIAGGLIAVGMHADALLLRPWLKRE